MTLLSRRLFLRGSGGLVLGTSGLGAYACGVEPGLMLDLTSYQVTPQNWPAGFALKIAVIADIHACEPWMPVSRIRSICELANSLNPDLTVILGDFNAGHNFVTAAVLPNEWAAALSELEAPLGVYAILGNHDWWHGPLPRMRSDGAKSIRKALHGIDIPVLENSAKRLVKDRQPFWLLGLADQLGRRLGRGQYQGFDNLQGTLRLVDDEAPIILLAHEPFIFETVPSRVALTLCGHTHGGQVNLPLLGAPFAQARFGSGHIYGHIVEQDRHMIISAGLGTSIAPVRLGRPPEVVEVTLGQAAVA
jgi:uncharacterized protein